MVRGHPQPARKRAAPPLGEGFAEDRRLGEGRDGSSFFGAFTKRELFLCWLSFWRYVCCALTCSVGRYMMCRSLTRTQAPTNAHARAHADAHRHRHRRTHPRTRTHAHTHTRACTHTRAHAHTRTRTHTHTHTHHKNKKQDPKWQKLRGQSEKIGLFSRFRESNRRNLALFQRNVGFIFREAVSFQEGTSMDSSTTAAHWGML